MLEEEIQKVRRGEMTMAQMEAALMVRRIARAEANGHGDDEVTRAHRARLRQLRGY